MKSAGGQPILNRIDGAIFVGLTVQIATENL